MVRNMVAGARAEVVQHFVHSLVDQLPFFACEISTANKQTAVRSFHGRLQDVELAAPAAVAAAPAVVDLHCRMES